MDHTINAALNDAQKSLLETYSLALTYGNNADAYAKTLLNLFEKTLQIKENGRRYDLALEKAKMQMTLEDFDKEYQEELQRGSKQTNKKGTKEYKEFQEKLRQMKIAHDNQNIQAGPSVGQSDRVECEEFVMETAVCTTDPLTKRQMQNPVKNKICGHHYEESSIFEAITINPRLRCPVAGCGNNSHVKKQHLVRDEQFKLQLANMASQEGDDNDDPLC